MEALDRVLSEAVARGALPGVVAAYADADGVQYRGAAGTRSEIAGDPIRTDAIFWIASMTKAVTSVAALQWVESGALDLDEPVSRLLPELAEPQRLEGFDRDGQPQLRRASAPITLRQLLTHTAGFGYELFHAELLRYHEQGRMPSVLDRGNDGFMAAPLVWEPGSEWEYGINTDWVGRLVERLSGQSLGEYCQERIFGPLGMGDTFYNIPAEKSGRLKTTHDRRSDGSLAERADEPQENVGFHMGGSGLFSTADDYLLFLRALLNGGRLGGAKLLDASLVSEAARDQIAPLTVRPLKCAVPAATNHCELGVGGGFGLGFAINPAPLATGRSAGSLAWAGLCNTYFWLDRSTQIAGVFLSQILPFYDALAVATFERFETAVYDAVRR